MKHEEKSNRTPIKARIWSINKKSSGSPAKVPEWKQVKLVHYFGRKSPKASKARETQPETNNKQNQGAKSPLLGEPSKPESPAPTSKGPGPIPEERGRGWGREGQKRHRRSWRCGRLTQNPSPWVLSKGSRLRG